MEKMKNAGLVFCLFVVLLVVFGSYFRASEVGAFFGAAAGTPLIVHVFNRLAPPRGRFNGKCSGRDWQIDMHDRVLDSSGPSIDRLPTFRAASDD